MAFDPIEKVDLVLRSMGQILIEERVEHAGIGKPNVSEAKAQLAGGLFDRNVFDDVQIKRAGKARPISARFTMQ